MATRLDKLITRYGAKVNSTASGTEVCTNLKELDCEEFDFCDLLQVYGIFEELELIEIKPVDDGYGGKQYTVFKV